MQNDLEGVIVGQSNARDLGIHHYQAHSKTFTQAPPPFPCISVLGSNLTNLPIRTTVVMNTKGELWVHQNSRYYHRSQLKVTDPIQ